MISRLLTLLRRHDGVAMPVVIGSLTLTTGLAAGVFAVSLEGQHASARDRDSKRALAAAEAGLQMGFLKLSQVRPAATLCVTDAAVATGTAHYPPGTGSAAPGECPSYTGSLGNGATYTYTVATPTSGACNTLPGKTASARDRCITSIGTVNGVRRRLQTKMLYIPPVKPFGEAGLVARDDIVIRSNEVNVLATVGANGNVTVQNGAKVTGGITVGPTGSWEFKTGGSSTQPGGYRAEDFTFADVWALYEDASKPTGNNNSSLMSSGFYNNATRAFTMGNNTSYTLQAGTYSFCSFLMQQGAKLRVPAGQIARIFIDSPARPGSTCPAGTGWYKQENSSEVNREFGADPAQLELYVWGKEGDNGVDTASIWLGNAAWLYAGVYGPDASLDLRNGGNLIGGATVQDAEIANNSDFIWDSRVVGKAIPGTAETDSRGWYECARDPTVSTDPESGCT